MRIAVVGGGAAGTAACWQAARRGAEVAMIHAGSGATGLYSGALDNDPWGQGERTAMDAAVLSFATAFDAWEVGAGRMHVVTDAGVVRPARGRDTALLDLDPLAGKRIAVASAAVGGWDGPAIARAAGASTWATRTGTRFEAVPVDPPGPGLDAAVPDYDRAAALDEADRAASFGDHLRDRIGEHDAMLLGPWLGTGPGVVDVVRQRLARPCGETTSAPGGPAGARFERGRDDLMETLGVARRAARVDALRRTPEGWQVVTAEEALGPFDGVVLASGGVVGGGIEMVDPSPGGPGRFRASLDAPVSVELHGHLVDAASTLHGVDLQSVGLEALEAVGLRVDAALCVVGAPGVSAAGDVVADRPRTVLRAVAMGLRAAASALEAVR